MSNSKLVSHTRISPNKSAPRNHAIDTVTVHCVVGQCSVETLGNIFSNPNKQASSNYGIGYDGRVGMYVEECDRSWCSSSSDNDNRAITIEVASETVEPYAVNDKAYKALIDLLVDICQRNGIAKLVWADSKDNRVNHRNGCNMTVHRDYANKSCPGEYLYSRMGEIAEKVNRILEGSADRYQSIEDVPKWAKAETQELIDLGALRGKGDELGLDVTEDMLRTMIINLRATKTLISGK